MKILPVLTYTYLSLHLQLVLSSKIFLKREAVLYKLNYVQVVDPVSQLTRARRGVESRPDKEVPADRATVPVQALQRDKTKIPFGPARHRATRRSVFVTTAGPGPVTSSYRRDH